MDWRQSAVKVTVYTKLPPKPGETVRTVDWKTMRMRLEMALVALRDRRSKWLVVVLRTVHLELGLLRK